MLSEQSTAHNQNSYQIATQTEQQDLSVQAFGSTARDIAFDFVTSLSFGTEIAINPTSIAVDMVGGSVVDAVEHAFETPGVPVQPQNDGTAIDVSAAFSPGQNEAPSMPVARGGEPLDLALVNLPGVQEKAAVVAEHFKTATGGGNTSPNVAIAA